MPRGMPALTEAHCASDDHRVLANRFEEHRDRTSGIYGARVKWPAFIKEDFEEGRGRMICTICVGPLSYPGQKEGEPGGADANPWHWVGGRRRRDEDAMSANIGKPCTKSQDHSVTRLVSCR